VGIGTRVLAYKVGRLGDAASLLYAEEIAVGNGYASGQPAVVHLGLGAETTCDLEIIFPHGRGTATRKGVKADQRLVIAK
jgi:hypothetical protein